MIFHHFFCFVWSQGEMYLSRIEETKLLVIDEADRMVEKGHFEELSKLLLRMNVYVRVLS